MLRRLKNAWRRRRLAKAGVVVEMDCPRAVYGGGGGSWTLCPATLRADSVIYSVGIGRDLSFDHDVIREHQATVHAFDPTPASLAWVRGQMLPPELKVHAYGLADVDGQIAFHPPRRARSAHYTPVRRYKTADAPPVMAPVKALPTIMAELGHDHIDLLKMDIEGGEYAVIDAIVKMALPVRQLLIEFHHMYETIPLARTVAAVHSLRRIGFKVFAISDRAYEISLLKPA